MRMLDLIGMVAPPLCAACQRPLSEGEDFLCTHCMLDLPRQPLVEDCTGPLRERISPRTAPITAMAAWTTYTHDGRTGELIRRGKYGRSPIIFKHLGRMTAHDLKASGRLGNIDVILPVPMHWTKRLRRGYNQARLLAIEIGHVLDVPVGDNLRASRPHRTQTRRNATERRTAMKGIFNLTAPDELRGLDIAIVDDIITTGGTLSAAVEAVMPASPASITIIVLAATQRV